MQADDLEAFEAFFVRHRTLIYRTAYGLTGDRQAAEEVLQDTFARAYRHRATLLPGLSPVPWLHRVKAESIGESTAAHLRDDGIEPAEQAEQQELRQIVREGIAALPTKHQSVVVLYYLNGLSLQETATFLGVAVGTVKSRLHYALTNLRDHLERDRRFAHDYRPLGRKEELEVPPA
jgi:RNA polymerase sigma-70 factor (ECF subfamily)